MNNKHAIIYAAITVSIGLQCAEVGQIVSLRGRLTAMDRGLVRLTQNVHSAEWGILLNSISEFDTIEPTVGSVQFLKRGHTITLTSVKYTKDGLVMRGLVGNPTMLFVSTLSLSFSVTKALHYGGEAFGGDPFLFMANSTIAEARTSPIALLPPRSSQPFVVTIPNVKQTQEGIRIQLTFTGERYSY